MSPLIINYVSHRENKPAPRYHHTSIDWFFQGGWAEATITHRIVISSTGTVPSLDWSPHGWAIRQVHLGHRRREAAVRPRDADDDGAWGEIRPLTGVDPLDRAAHVGRRVPFCTIRWAVSLTHDYRHRRRTNYTAVGVDFAGFAGMVAVVVVTRLVVAVEGGWMRRWVVGDLNLGVHWGAWWSFGGMELVGR